MDGHFLQADDVVALRDEALGAEAAGAAAVIVRGGPLGDPTVLAAGLSTAVRRARLGVWLSLTTGRHPAVVARELTTLDLVCGGRSVLCVAPPFDRTADLAEALGLCRALWRDGVADGGSRFPVVGAVNHPQPATDASPLVALDLTAGGEASPDLVDQVDLLLWPSGTPAVCRMEPV